MKTNANGASVSQSKRWVQQSCKRFDRILALFPRQTTIQRDTAGDNSTWLAPTAWTSLLNVANWVAKWLYIGIGLPKDINLDAFVRRTVTASDSTCPADGVSLEVNEVHYGLCENSE